MKYLVLAALLFYIDYYYKRKVESEMEPGRDVKIAAGGKVLIRRVENKGTCGGYLADKAPYVRIAATCAAALASLRFLTLLPFKGRGIKKTAYAFFVAGSLSNLYDRWVRGRVTDYISLANRKIKGISRVVFNMADVFIMAGGIVLLLVNLFGKKK